MRLLRELCLVSSDEQILMNSGSSSIPVELRFRESAATRVVPGYCLSLSELF